MRFDLDFLYNSKINETFNFAKSGDPFLINLIDFCPIDQHFIYRIREAQYIILQEFSIIV
jgi:hypothetical protein